MISDPYVTVECDECQASAIKVGLTALARGSWDTRNVDAEIRSHGWIVDGHSHYCDDAECQQKYRNASGR